MSNNQTWSSVTRTHNSRVLPSTTSTPSTSTLSTKISTTNKEQPQNQDETNIQKRNSNSGTGSKHQQQRNLVGKSPHHHNSNYKHPKSSSGERTHVAKVTHHDAGRKNQKFASSNRGQSKKVGSQRPSAPAPSIERKKAHYNHGDGRKDDSMERTSDMQPQKNINMEDFQAFPPLASLMSKPPSQPNPPIQIVKVVRKATESSNRSMKRGIDDTGVNNQHQHQTTKKKAILKTSTETTSAAAAAAAVRTNTNIKTPNSKTSEGQKKKNRLETKQPSISILSKKKVINFDTKPSLDINRNDNTPQIFSIHTDNMLQGKQKLRSKKKRLTPLKKQVLKERFIQWRRQEDQTKSIQSETATICESNPKTEVLSSIVYIHGYVDEEDQMDDEEENEEILSDLRDMAEKCGSIVPNGLHVQNGFSFVHFEAVTDAIAARHCWHDIIIGGNRLQTGVLHKEILNGYFEKKDLNPNEWMEVLKNINFTNLLKEKNNLIPCPSVNPEKNISVIVLGNILCDDDFEDESCMEESLDDIRMLAAQYGTLTSDKLRVERNEDDAFIYITYQVSHEVAVSIVSQLDGMVIGGQIISAAVLNEPSNSENKYIVWIENLLSEDDFEDEECLEESKRDIEKLVARFGKVIQLDLSLEGATKGRVSVCYDNESSTVAAVSDLNGLVVGGLIITAMQPISAARPQKDLKPSSLLLENILTEDDYEDEDCMEETKSDVLELLSKYGNVTSCIFETNGDKKGQILISFAEGSSALTKSVQELNGFMFGGTKIMASQFPKVNDLAVGKKKILESVVCKKEDEAKPAPMYSGDKIIPEQYAECKRVPKIPNTGLPRSYASLSENDTATPLLYEMLGELTRLQLRSKDDKNAKARRRLVMGLREVARGVRANKMKMIVMANNLDEYGVIDSKLQEIIDMAGGKEIPVIYELNKRKLGRAIGKNIKISVVGIQNADGAQQQFKKLKNMFL